MAGKNDRPLNKTGRNGLTRNQGINKPLLNVYSCDVKYVFRLGLELMACTLNWLLRRHFGESLMHLFYLEFVFSFQNFQNYPA